MTSDRNLEIERVRDLLPPFMADDAFGDRFVAIFDTLTSDVLARVAGVGAYFTPSIAPLDFVWMLAGWTNVPLHRAWEDDPVGDDQHARSFVTEASPLFRWRGTRRGLESLVGAATGCEVVVRDPAIVYQAGKRPAQREDGPVEIRLRGASARLSSAQIDALVRAQLPVGVPYKIIVEDVGGLDE